MSTEPASQTPNPYVLVAFCCGVASVAIAFLSLIIMHGISDAGMWAIAFMSAAPSAMGVGIAYVMSKQPPRT